LVVSQEHAFGPLIAGGRCDMKSLVQWRLLLFIVMVGAGPRAGAQAAEIQQLSVALNGDTVAIHVSLTEGVVPTVLLASNPDRLVLQLPNTAAPAKQETVTVNQNGVKGVRIGLNRAAPPVARVVVDLNTLHPYELAMNGHVITLTVLPISWTPESRPTEVKQNSGWTLARLWRRQPNGALSPSATGADGAALVQAAQAQPGKSLRTKFLVKYVAEGAAYLNGGRGAGIAPGMKLAVRDVSLSTRGEAAADAPVAELLVISTAQNSAVTEIHGAKRAIKTGDWAYLSKPDIDRIVTERMSSPARKRPLSNAFVRDDASEADTIVTARRALSPEESRIRARIGVDYSAVRSSGSTLGSSSQRGMSVQADMMRIAGTHWNLQGYWRGRLNTHAQTLDSTIQDYLDKTYTLQLVYDNPDSRWVAGFGRLYLPWAISLDTIDGGYFGRKFGTGITAGVFAGSTPDPTSWHYRPDQRIAGSFVNTEGGTYDKFHYSSTAGLALSTLKWTLDQPYLFFENSLSYTRYVSLYHSLIVDDPRGPSTGGIRPGAGISRSYLNVRLQPHPRLSVDFSHNYFRDVPTAVTQLIGTGLLDKLLYEGVSVGVRVEPVRHFFVYTTLGQSEKTGDVRRSLNQMYGITWNEIGRSGLRADVHYSKFDSSFAQGSYRVLTLSRHLGDRILWDAQVGSQSLLSAFTANNQSLFFDTSFDTNLGSHTFLQSGYTIERGAQLNYDQWYLSLGYRFDVRGPGRAFWR
jgi:hypothetical protein